MDTDTGLAILEQPNSDLRSPTGSDLLDALLLNWTIEHAEPRSIETIKDLRAAAQAALATPLASLRLAELCGEATRAAIVLGAASLELAHGLLLPVVDEIRLAGTLAQNISVLVASQQQAAER